MIALLTLAVAAVVGAEWPRLSARFGAQERARKARTRRKESFRLLRNDTEAVSEPDRRAAREFAASVERDLDRLPTIEENHPPPR